MRRVKQSANEYRNYRERKKWIKGPQRTYRHSRESLNSFEGK